MALCCVALTARVYASTALFANNDTTISVSNTVTGPTIVVFSQSLCHTFAVVHVTFMLVVIANLSLSFWLNLLPHSKYNHSNACCPNYC